MPARPPATSTQDALTETGLSALQYLLLWLKGWWQVVRLGAQVMTLTLSLSSYRRPFRQALARQLYVDTVPLLTWFSVLSILAALVLVRIVTVTSQSYGLSQYAIEMVVRVLVLELIPLSAALFVALQSTIPDSSAVAARHGSEKVSLPVLRFQVWPRVLAGQFAVFTLAALSGVISMLLTYISLYGFSPWGVALFNANVGQIFSPVVSLIFVLKLLSFSIVVALVPLGSKLYLPKRVWLEEHSDLQMLIRVCALLILVEMVSLLGNYS